MKTLSEDPTTRSSTGSPSNRKTRSPDDERARAVKYAFLLLRYRGRSERELRKRLELKGFGSEAADEAVTYLAKAGYVDDDALAQALRWEAADSKFLGKRGAEAFLFQRGIPRREASEALEDYDELEAAQLLAERKLRTMGGLEDRKLRSRLTGHMRRRGYSYGTIRVILGNLRKEDKPV